MINPLQNRLVSVFSQRFKASLRRRYYRFINFNGTPRKIALGFALGIMVGMTPFLGVHIITCVSLAAMLGWSKLTALLGCQITNFLTAPLIYPLNYWVGLKLIGMSNDVKWTKVSDGAEMFDLMKQSPQILVDLFVGGVIVGMPLAIAAYIAVLKIFRLYRRRTPAVPSDHCSH